MTDDTVLEIIKLSLMHDLIVIVVLHLLIFRMNDALDEVLVRQRAARWIESQDVGILHRTNARGLWLYIDFIAPQMGERLRPFELSFT